MTAAEYWSRFAQIVDAVTSVQPVEVVEVFSGLRQMRDGAATVAGVITRHFKPLMTAEAAPDESTMPEDVQMKLLGLENQIRAEGGTGKSAAGIDGTLIMQLIQFLMANPAIVTWFLALFNKKPA